MGRFFAFDYNAHKKEFACICMPYSIFQSAIISDSEKSSILSSAFALFACSFPLDAIYIMQVHVALGESKNGCPQVVVYPFLIGEGCLLIVS